MSFKVDELVETPLGVGKVFAVGGDFYGFEKIYQVKIKNHIVGCVESELKPYKSGSDKLREYGYSGYEFQGDYYFQNEIRTLNFYHKRQVAHIGFGEYDYEYLKMLVQCFEEFVLNKKQGE